MQQYTLHVLRVSMRFHLISVELCPLYYVPQSDQLVHKIHRETCWLRSRIHMLFLEALLSVMFFRLKTASTSGGTSLFVFQKYVVSPLPIVIVVVVTNISLSVSLHGVSIPFPCILQCLPFMPQASHPQRFYEIFHVQHPDPIVHYWHAYFYPVDFAFSPMRSLDHTHWKHFLCLSNASNQGFLRDFQRGEEVDKL